MKRVVLLCHESLVPPSRVYSLTEKYIENQSWRTEAYVARELRALGYEVCFCGLDAELEPLRKMLANFQPDLVFNMLEEFAGEAWLEPFVTSFLDAEGVPFTGCSSESLFLAKNKMMAKEFFVARGVLTPGTAKYPKIVKYADEESSAGLTAKSVVKNKAEETAQIRRLMKKRPGACVFAEEYIAGRELHVAVMPVLMRPNRRPSWQHNGEYTVSPAWETYFGDYRGPKFLSEKLKWNFKFRDQKKVILRAATDLDVKTVARIRLAAERSAAAIRLDGPARVDIRLTADGHPYVIEINPNPDLAKTDEFVSCIASAGYSYSRLIEEICRAGLARRKVISPERVSVRALRGRSLSRVGRSKRNPARTTL